MIFDVLCRFAEMVSKDINQEFLCPLLRKIPVFLIEAPYKDDDTWHSSKEALLKNGFFLPFDECAIQVINECCFLFRDINPRDDGMCHRREMVIFAYDQINKCYTLFFGDLVHDIDDTGINNQSQINQILVLTRDLRAYLDTKSLDDFRRQVGEEYYVSITGGLTAHLDQAMQLIYRLNEPKNFIMEAKPKIKRSKNKKIPRLHSRPTYTVLRPNAIRRQLGMAMPQEYKGGKKRPHERRRHERFLSDDRYKYQLDGRIIDPKIIPYGPRAGQLYYKKIMVPPVWIGPSTAKKGNKIYRVIL